MSSKLPLFKVKTAEYDADGHDSYDGANESDAGDDSFLDGFDDDNKNRYQNKNENENDCMIINYHNAYEDENKISNNSYDKEDLERRLLCYCSSCQLPSSAINFFENGIFI